MATEYTVAVLVGSLRTGSYNRMLAATLAELAPTNLCLEITAIADLPLYNEELEDNPPASWTRFRKAIQAADAVLCVTPEYNRSIPAALKNAVDVGSRPMNKSVWNGMPLAIVSASPGSIGGFGASQHLRQSFSCLNVALLPGPEVYISGVNKLFDDQRKLQNEGTSQFLQKFIQTFTDWIRQHG